MSDTGPAWTAIVRQRLAERQIDATLHPAVVEELSQHLELRFQSLLAKGSSVDEARRLTLDELEDAPALGAPGRRADAAAPVDALERELRRAERALPKPAAALGEPRRPAAMESFLLDLRYAVRSLRRSPGFASVAVLTLALGVGVNTAIFSVVNAVMLRPLPFPNASRLVRIFESNPERGWPLYSASDPNFLDWQARTTRWEALAAFDTGSVSFATDAGVEVIPALRATAEFLPALGFSPVLGRNFRLEEERPGSNGNVAIISDGLWRRAFGARAEVIGASVRLNDTPHTIIGVLPERFTWNDAELIRPRALDPNRSRGDHQLSVIGLLESGATLDEGRAELETIAAQLAQQYPVDNHGWTVRLLTFYDWLLPQQARQSLLVLQTAVLLVLLIACLNLANLLLARGAARQRELAIRVSLGASRGRILWHGLMESSVLALVSAAVGVAVAAVTIRVLSVYAASIVPRADEAAIDTEVIGFALGCALVSAAAFGLLPSLHAARDQGHAPHESTRTTSGRGRHRIRATLTVAEVALSVALLIGAGLLLRSFVTLQRVEPGFDVDAVMTGRVMLASATAFDTAAKRRDLWNRLLAEVATVPGVSRVATGSAIPFTSGSTSTEIAVPGAAALPGVQPSADWRVISPGYFAAMGVSLRGRDFTPADGPGAAPVIIVSEALAARYWPNQDPLGKTIIVRTLGNRERTVIGVAGDVRSFGLDREIRPMVYFSGIEAPVFGQMYLLWRSATAQSQALAVREAIGRVSQQVAFHDVRPAAERLSSSFGPRRFNLYLLALFAMVALVLAVTGLFGVMAYLVAQRTREIGVRLALGASRVDVFRQILGRGLALAAGGALLGLAGAVWLARLMESLLFSVSRTDPLTFAAVPLAMVVVACAACVVPARRAMRVDPVIALRAE